MDFQKILVVEDSEGNKKGVVAQLEELNIGTIDHAQFCDDAYLKIKTALQQGDPFQLLICDLMFTPVYGRNTIPGGVELIQKIREEQPEVKIIVFTVEEKQSTIRSLIEKQQINAYVCKGLNGLKELTNALAAVAKGKVYTCPVATASLKKKNAIQLSDYELNLLQLLAQGFTQKQISHHLESKKIVPNSIRSIEDRISKLKDSFNASTQTQLIYLANSLGLI